MKIYNSKWTEELSIKEALKFSNRCDFFKTSPRAYEILRKNGLLDSACKHMKKPYADSIKWTKNKCKKAALKYQYRHEFQLGNKKAYEAAKNHGWLNEVCSHMKYKKLPNGYWDDFNHCKKRALKYKFKKDFIKTSPHVYSISLKNDWIDEICSHMIPTGSKYDRCIYSYEFEDNHVYVGLTFNLSKRKNSRKSDESDSVTKYINETGLIPKINQLTEYIPVREAIIKEKEFLDNYVNDGWIPLNKNKTGGIGGYSVLDLE
jgi:predicted GIY-YIG superfamily endonuclease